jgi:pentatricopeptide repeat protein
MAILRPQEAERNFRKAFDLDPADPAALAAFSEYFLFTKRKQDAENVFKVAIERKPSAPEPRWGLANLYVQEKSFDKAIEVLNDMVKQNPGNTPAQLRLAELYMGQKDATKAEESVRSVLARDKNNAVAHYLLGKILLDRKDLDKALAEFDTALKLQDRFLPPYLDKANLLLARGDLEGSQNTLNSALQRDRNNMLIRGAIAKVLALRQKPEGALQEAEEVLAVLPDNIDAITARADALQSLGKLDEATKEYLKLCGLQPGNAAHWNRLGIVEAARGDPASGLLHFRKAVELKPDFIAAINNLVVVQLRNKKYDEALTELGGLSKRGAPQDEIHRLSGQVYLAKGEDAAAERELRKAIEVNPQNYQSYILLGQMNAQRNNIPQALKEVDQLIAVNAKFVPAYLLKAFYLDSSKDVAGAIENYRRVLQIDPENTIAANNLAWLLCENGTTFEEALSLAQSARRKFPDDPEIADTLGWVYYKMRNYTLAVDQLSFSISHRQNPVAEHYYRLGMAFYGKGDLRMAQQTLRKSLELNPNLSGAEEARKILRLPS